MAAQDLIEQFAQAIVDRAFDHAEAMLAPWIRTALPEGGLKRLVRLAGGDNPPAASFEVASLPYNDPASMREHAAEYADANRGRTLANCEGAGGAYGPPSLPIPDALTDASFGGVWRLEFIPDEDLDSSVDYSYALYTAAVADGDAYAIGYLEPMD